MMASPPPMTNSKKRRFQAPITNYFTESASPAENDTSNAVSHTNYSAPTHSPNPALPTKVQSSLLAVGMRVRKSVPEGYRTTEKTTRLDAGTYRTIHNPSDFSTSSQSSTSSTELAPLCGMFKVGNLATQTVPRSSFDNASGSTRGLEGSSSFSNQESTYSIPAIPALNPHKRCLEPDDDSGSDEQSEPWASSSQIPRRTAFSPKNNNALRLTTLPSRPILTPKLGQKSKRVAFKTPKANDSQCLQSAWDQENRQHSLAADFEDADFLRRREEVDDELNVTEVEMGGI